MTNEEWERQRLETAALRVALDEYIHALKEFTAHLEQVSEEVVEECKMRRSSGLN